MVRLQGWVHLTELIQPYPVDLEAARPAGVEYTAAGAAPQLCVRTSADPSRWIPLVGD